MSRTQTLIAAIMLFVTLPSNAQYTQNFEATSLTSGCATITNVFRTVDPLEVISGLGSLYSNPPVNGSGTRDYATPYLNVLTNSVTVSFSYKLNEALVGQATRTIEIGMQTQSGTFTSLYTISMDRNNDPVAPVSYTGTFPITAGIKKLVLKMAGGNGNGTTRIIIDDVVVNANTLYSGGCNTSPTIKNDLYTTPLVTTFTGTSVLDNDIDPNGETLGTPTLTTPSPDGTVVLNPDGTFTFTPNAGFIGVSTTFVYTVFDNGFEPASGTGVVTIFFQSLSPLPVKLTAFQGALSNNHAKLIWSVSENETGDHFEIEKSAEGRSFAKIATVATSSTHGIANYTFVEPDLLNGGWYYYRLRIVNNDGSSSYSKIIYLRNDGKEAAGQISYLKNPVQSSISFNYDAQEAGLATISIYNMAGATLQTFRVSLQKGTNAITQPASSLLTPGTYVMEIKAGNERITAKLVK